MKKFINIFLLLLLPCTLAMRADVVTTVPTPLQEDSENVEIYFHADEGNKGLMGMPQDTHIYAHTGVEVIDASGKTTSWKYAPKWEVDDPKYQLSYVSENLWKLYIGDIREYYGVDPTEQVKKLCFLFRNTGGTKKGADEGDADIFVDVADGGFQLTFRHSRSMNIIDSDKNHLTFTANTTEAADIKILIDGTEVASVSGNTTLRTPYEFPEKGLHKVTCTATNGEVTRTSNLDILYINDNKPAADTTIPALGLTKNSDGSYTFCVAAPEKKNAVVIGSWNDWVPTAEAEMEYVDRKIDGADFRYFKATIPASKIKSPFSYYFVYDASRAATDPYARLVLDNSMDRYVSDEVFPNLPEYPEGKVPASLGMLAYWDDTMLNYTWTAKDWNLPWKEHLVIYEMLFRDFTGTEGKAKGNGTVRKAIEKIPYLKELGVNAVELLPINEFNGNNSWGYNPNFYFATDKAYGTPRDYKEFIDECHANGIAVILDVVFNQSDGNHPWLKMYGSTSASPFYNQNAPHAFSVLNDWNQGYPLVEEQWKDCVQFWLKEYNVDGFRFDLVKGLGDNESYTNNGSTATGAYNKSRVERMKRIHDAMREIKPGAFFINENLAGSKEENEMAEDGELNWANVNDPGCQFAMGYTTNASLTRMNAAKDARTPGSTVAYLESHDEQRLGYKQITWGVEGVKDNHAVACQRLGSAAAQMILCPGAHMIWMFSEIGNSQNTKSDNGDNNTSPKIVNWSLLDDPDNKGVFDSYKELINIRKANYQLFPATKDFANKTSGWANGRSIITKVGDKELYCFINPNITGELEMDCDFTSSSNDAYWILSKSLNSNPSFDAAAKKVTIPANCYVVITSRNVSGINTIGSDTPATGLSVAGLHGAIRFHNVESPVEVYTLAGRRVATVNSDSELSVAPGVYVARSAAKSIKVLVK